MRPLLRPAMALGSIFLLGLAVACSDNDPSALLDDSDKPALIEPTAADTGTRDDTTEPGDTAAPSDEELSVAELVALIDPSVVRIQTSGGVGTGFVVAEDGYILTNYHVVSGFDGPTSSIVVTMSDGAEHEAEVVGFDQRTDLALLSIDASGLQPVAIGNLDETFVGQDVVAIGYALDLGGGEGPAYSVTRGIISAKNRAIEEGATDILGSLQTDAAITNGNSGGPLVNLYGEVVGVNTAVAPNPTTGTIAPGIGFAVGADTVSAVLAELMATGSVDRGLLGIGQFEALRPAQATGLGLDADQGGVVIGTVSPNSPVDDAGMLPEDIITRIGDYEIDDEADLAVALIDYNAGDTVEVEFFRGGEPMTTDVTLGQAP